MSAPKSNRLVMFGVAIFAVSATAIFLVLLGDEETPTTGTPQAGARATTTPTVPGADGAIRTNPATRAIYQIPKGFEAVAIQLKGAPGLAGYAARNDLVNVYATVRSAPRRQVFAKLIVRGARVLDLTAPQPGTEGNTTYLLALTTADAERVIFTAKFETLWFSLARADQSTARTPGHGYTNTF